MPDLNEFFDKEDKLVLDDNRIEIIEQMRPCSVCDLFVPSYNFNNQTFEMYWKCANGHETRYKVA